MHVFKVLLLLVLTLAVMRAASWGCLWLLRWALARDNTGVRLAANVLALVAFAVFLRIDSVPGELLDLRALAFGIVVYAVCFAIDLRWLPRFLSSLAETRP